MGGVWIFSGKTQRVNCDFSNVTVQKFNVFSMLLKELQDASKCLIDNLLLQARQPITHRDQE